uniref:Uncharacterized protein n=1 Tax=Anguilla anguilla TaxID=7936 RepID=A0A0E9QEE7_ANGAN
MSMHFRAHPKGWGFRPECAGETAGAVSEARHVLVHLSRFYTVIIW